MNSPNLKKYFLRIMVLALSISALVGIIIFLVGDLGGIETRILITTLAIGGFSLIGLCCATIYDRNELLKVFSILGMLITVSGFCVSLAMVWKMVVLRDAWQTMLIFLILPVTFGHISLLLQIRPKTTAIKLALAATIIFVIIVAAMLINSTTTEFHEDEFYFRLLGVFAIVDLLGTITTPILNRTIDKEISS